MSENPSPARRTRRARRGMIDAHDALERGNQSSRVQLPEGEVLVADAPPLIEQDFFVNEAPAANGEVVPQVSQDLEVPFEAQFGGKDYLPAPGLRRMAQRLIHRDQRLRHLTDQRIEFLWKRRGGTRRGVPNIGDCAMPGGLAKHAWNAMARALTGSSSEQVIYVIWLASDHLETFTPLQVEASLYRQLCKTGVDPRDHSAFKLRAPDFNGFVAEIERYGLWNQSLVQAAPAFEHAAHPASQGDPWDTPMETTLLNQPVETTGEG